MRAGPLFTAFYIGPFESKVHHLGWVQTHVGTVVVELANVYETITSTENNNVKWEKYVQS